MVKPAGRFRVKSVPTGCRNRVYADVRNASNIMIWKLAARFSLWEKRWMKSSRSNSKNFPGDEGLGEPKSKLSSLLPPGEGLDEVLAKQFKKFSWDEGLGEPKSK